MALITCPDCTTQISDMAPQCPTCGRPMSSPRRAPPGAGILIGPAVVAVIAYLIANAATTGGIMLTFSLLMAVSSILFMVRLVRLLLARR